MGAEQISLDRKKQTLLDFFIQSEESEKNIAYYICELNNTDQKTWQGPPPHLCVFCLSLRLRAL